VPGRGCRGAVRSASPSPPAGLRRAPPRGGHGGGALAAAEAESQGETQFVHGGQRQAALTADETPEPGPVNAGPAGEPVQRGPAVNVLPTYFGRCEKPLCRRPQPRGSQGSSPGC